jgi:predicted small metal-binding protein
MKTSKIHSKSEHTYTKSIYNPILDNLEGKILFKEKYERAKESLSKTIIPQAIINKIKREFGK